MVTDPKESKTSASTEDLLRRTSARLSLFSSDLMNKNCLATALIEAAAHLGTGTLVNSASRLSRQIGINDVETASPDDFLGMIKSGAQKLGMEIDEVQTHPSFWPQPSTEGFRTPEGPHIQIIRQRELGTGKWRSHAVFHDGSTSGQKRIEGLKGYSWVTAVTVTLKKR